MANVLRDSRPMDDSLADWLTLREPFDAAARSDTLTRADCRRRCRGTGR